MLTPAALGHIYVSSHFIITGKRVINKRKHGPLSLIKDFLGLSNQDEPRCEEAGLRRGEEVLQLRGGLARQKENFTKQVL